MTRRDIPDDPVLRLFLERSVPIIVATFRPERVIVFGSRARGDAGPDSDLDVIVVSRAFAGVKFPERPRAVSRAIRFPRGVDCLCYTPEEFLALSSESLALRDALSEGLDAA